MQTASWVGCLALLSRLCCYAVRSLLHLSVFYPVCHIFWLDETSARTAFSNKGTVLDVSHMLQGWCNYSWSAS